MAGGAYVALSGLRSRADHLERLASDIANAGTSGYKAERGTTSARGAADVRPDARIGHRRRAGPFAARLPAGRD